ncbi:hypothetical protein [Reyranella sp.]|uniref:hypothetical protein n=1 Tax=Reyranella sp. TaxID=1929291 RepID=UPI003C7A09D1
MAEVPLRNPFAVNPEAVPPPSGAGPGITELFRRVVAGELDATESLEARLLLMQFLSGGATVVLNGLFLPDGALDIRTRSFFIDRNVGVRLVSNSDCVEAARDATFDGPIPSEEESVGVKTVADWFRDQKK